MKFFASNMYVQNFSIVFDDAFTISFSIVSKLNFIQAPKCQARCWHLPSALNAARHSEFLHGISDFSRGRLHPQLHQTNSAPAGCCAVAVDDISKCCFFLLGCVRKMCYTFQSSKFPLLLLSLF